MTNKEYRQDPGISRSDLFEMRKSPLHFQYQMTHPKGGHTSSVVWQITSQDDSGAGGL